MAAMIAYIENLSEKNKTPKPASNTLASTTPHQNRGPASFNTTAHSLLPLTTPTKDRPNAETTPKPNRSQNRFVIDYPFAQHPTLAQHHIVGCNLR